jgi:2-oxoglutarate dehydrogenase E2 component (dihydrolipoamide succinyltransferase)
MATEIKVPALGESVSEATVAKWFKSEGEAVAVDEAVVELETDKVTIEVPSPVAGIIAAITVKEGETVNVGAVLGAIAEGGAATAAPKPAAKKPAAAKSAPAPAAAPAPVPAPAAAAGAASLSPAVRKLAAEASIDVAAVAGSGKDGRVTKGDVVDFLDAKKAATAPAPAPSPAPAPTPTPSPRAPVLVDQAGREERVKMTRLRATIARRLKEAQNTAAMLTTFNEVDMSAVMAMRSQFKALFEQKHGVKLGFMGFFVKACIQALIDIPAVNAEIDGDDLVYKNYYNIGVAVGTDRGLVVPVVRDADRLSLAGIEKAIADLGKKARDGSMKIEDLQAGTFTISNGGVYGSLMSTPILNAPQSGILGMHKIQDRPMVVDGRIEVRPMMYLALSYDHRIVDGKEAVTFLVRVKESLEAPQRMIMDL